MILIALGAPALAYGARRYWKFRKGPVYPKYIASKRENKIARIEAKNRARLHSLDQPHDYQPQVQRVEERKEIIREIVMVKCTYCGTLNPQGAQKCSSCGARM